MDGQLIEVRPAVKTKSLEQDSNGQSSTGHRGDIDLARSDQAQLEEE